MDVETIGYLVAYSTTQITLCLISCLIQYNGNRSPLSSLTASQFRRLW